MIYQLFADNLVEEARIDLPASKSLSNRALILKALCTQSCQLSHLSDCDDTAVMLRAFAPEAADAVSPRVVDIGAAGTSMRFLTAYYATHPGADVILTGSERMKQRPIKILVEALRSLGADIEYTDNEGFPPLRIRGKRLEGGQLSIDGSTSSQYISALLMVAPTLSHGLQLFLAGQVTSRPYIEMTLALMRQFGIESSFKESYIEIEPQTYQAQDYVVESDWSAASYWYEMMALSRPATQTGDHPLHRITLLGLQPDSLQGDSAIARFFAQLGISTEFVDEGALLTTTDQPLPDRVDWDLASQPDLAQTIIATLCALGVPFRIQGLHTLRIKETDRIAALLTELGKCGYQVEAKGDDVMLWDGALCTKADPVIIDTYQDHRMAMAFAPLAITMFRNYGQELTDVADADALYVNHPEVVSKSYPTFWDDMRLVQTEINPIDREPDDYLQYRRQTMLRIANTHHKAKVILNTGLVLVGLLIIVVILLFCLL